MYSIVILIYYMPSFRPDKYTYIDIYLWTDQQICTIIFFKRSKLRYSNNATENKAENMYFVATCEISQARTIFLN